MRLSKLNLILSKKNPSVKTVWRIESWKSKNIETRLDNLSLQIGSKIYRRIRIGIFSKIRSF